MLYTMTKLSYEYLMFRGIAYFEIIMKKSLFCFILPCFSRSKNSNYTSLVSVQNLMSHISKPLDDDN